MATNSNPLPGLIWRQPTTNAQGAVVAYELSALPALGHTVDVFVQYACPGLAGSPADELASLQALHQQGAHLAFDHTVLQSQHAPVLALAHYIVLDVATLTPDEFKAAAALVQARSTGQVLACAIRTAEQFRMASANGATRFQGDWVAHPPVIKNKAMATGQASVLQLINLVRKQADVGEIDAVLKQDAMLGFKLMRLINSAGFGRTHEVASFRHAVMLLGLDRLFRWTALLLTAASTTGAPAVVGATAVVRGRMMELLAPSALSPEEGDNAFTVGLFSMLDEMLGLPMDQALVLLPLPPSINQALRYGSGPYGPLLLLVKACETRDAQALQACAAALKLDAQQVNTAHMDALAWAAQLAI